MCWEAQVKLQLENKPEKVKKNKKLYHQKSSQPLNAPIARSILW